MIRFSHGIKRRVSALLCVVVLVFALAFFPVRARAAAATAAAAGLTAVGFAVTVAAFLNASGVFPYEAYTEGEISTFGAWSEEKLGALIEQYNATNPATLISSQTIRAYASGATICVVSSAWGALRAFVQWVKDTFTPADNQTGVEVGRVVGGWSALSVSASSPSRDTMLSEGLVMGVVGDYTWYYMASVSGVYPAYFRYGGSGTYLMGLISKAPFTRYYWQYPSANGVMSYYYTVDGGADAIINDGISYSYYYAAQSYAGISEDNLIVSIPRFDGVSSSGTKTARDEAARALYGFDTGVVAPPVFEGIVADTSAVSVPVALPEGAEFGGLQVAELGAGATAQALEDVIEGGVMERQQPLVRPVEVQVQQGVEVDSETGVVTENPVIITPDSVALVSSEFALPTAISTVFPFSIPWDVLRVYQALDAEPAFPEIHASLYVPYSSVINPDYVDDKIPFTIGIPEDMKAGFDAFAAKFRAIALLLACIAVTWAMAKFIRW